MRVALVAPLSHTSSPTSSLEVLCLDVGVVHSQVEEQHSYRDVSQEVVGGEPAVLESIPLLLGTVLHHG